MQGTVNGKDIMANIIILWKYEQDRQNCTIDLSMSTENKDVSRQELCQRILRRNKAL